MLDTNILISMFLFPTENMNRLKHELCEKHRVLLCSYVVDEIKDVISRKFKSKEKDLEMFFQSFPFTLVYTPEDFEKEKYPEIRDSHDLPVLVSAIAEGADILITGDKDFSDVEIDRPEILTPNEYLTQYGREYRISGGGPS